MKRVRTNHRRIIRQVLILQLCLLLMAGVNWRSARGEDAEASQSKVPKPVRALIEAFNAHSPEKMAQVMASDIEVYYVDAKGKTAKASDNAETLVGEMKGYFRALPDVKSHIDSHMVTGRYISVNERVEWTRESKKVTQYSLSVYEIREEKIKRVWYYPAQR